MDAPREEADKLLGELAAESGRAAPSPAARAPTMGLLQRVTYTHQALIDSIIAHPDWTQNQHAELFGYSASWVSNIMASDAFKEQMAARRAEIVDPAMRKLIEERFEALAARSLEILLQKLNAPQVSDNVALRAAELGAKALGFGGQRETAPPPITGDHLVKLADRLVGLRSRVYENEAPEGAQGAG